MTELETLASGPVSQFRDWPNPAVPIVAAGVYTIWDGPRLVYVGMAGRALTPKEIAKCRRAATKKGLRGRLGHHAAGRRSGDQFCVYVADRFVLPTLSPAEIAQVAAGELSLDARVKRYIHERFCYRWVETPDSASAYALEARICQGALAVGRPLLNGKARSRKLSARSRSRAAHEGMQPFVTDSERPQR